MFDKMIESAAAGADLKKRRKYFATSAAIVGVLFITAVVISIYSAEFGVHGSFEVSILAPPIEMAAAEPPKPEPRTPTAPVTHEKNTLPTRVVNMARVDEPTAIPTTTSVVKNPYAARPNTAFTISKVDTDPAVEASAAGPTRSGDTSGTTTASIGTRPTGSDTVDAEKPSTPPPAKPVKPHVPPTQTKGVINSLAIDLPKPVYPPPARQVHAMGTVSVQVTLDEKGNVIAASALSGHPLLRDSAVRAARDARFTPTLLSGVPVKVTGIITYNFTL